MSISGTNEATQSVPFGTPVATGDANAAGTAGTAARSDHVHKGVVAAVAWTSWTPTLANLTLGNGTLTTKYVTAGKTIHWSFKFTLGTTSAVGSGPSFTLPVAAAGGFTGGVAIGVDTGNGPYQLLLREVGTHTLGFYRTSGVTANLDVALSATVPHAWGSTDVIEAHGSYEAA